MSIIKWSFTSYFTKKQPLPKCWTFSTNIKSWSQWFSNSFTNDHKRQPYSLKINKRYLRECVGLNPSKSKDNLRIKSRSLSVGFLFIHGNSFSLLSFSTYPTFILRQDKVLKIKKNLVLQCNTWFYCNKIFQFSWFYCIKILLKKFFFLVHFPLFSVTDNQIP